MRFLLSSLLATSLLATAGSAFAQDQTPPQDEEVYPPVVPDAEDLVEGDREVDPPTYDSFAEWLAARGPIPGVGDAGGFTARELLDRPLHARPGNEIGQIINIAFDATATAKFLLIRLSDDGVRAVPVESLIVSGDDELFTEMTPAQVENLPRPGRDDG